MQIRNRIQFSTNVDKREMDWNCPVDRWMNSGENDVKMWQGSELQEWATETGAFKADVVVGLSTFQVQRFEIQIFAKKYCNTYINIVNLSCPFVANI